MHLARILALSALLLSACGKSEPLTGDKTPVNSGPAPEPGASPFAIDAASAPAPSVSPAAQPGASPAASTALSPK